MLVLAAYGLALFVLSLQASNDLLEANVMILSLLNLSLIS